MNTPITQGASGHGMINAPSREQLLQAGDIVGHCRVIELLAAGGMANVYKVWHEQLEVIRAVKILKPGYSEESKGRLETEAKISANLRHTNIVEIYGMGYWNTIPYIEMEYIDGPSMKELLEKNIRLPVQFSLSVIHCVCTALQFAYNQDMTLYGKVYDRLIHRDIKPANILITSDGVVKLADFGIARPSEVSIHTKGSKVMGTFAYLSPEQLNGEKLDQRSDVYSLATVLYEMLTGSKTFPQKLLAELVQRKSRGQFIPVGSMGVRLSRQLCCAIEKSLALDRTKRYCDAGEFDIEISSALRKMTKKSPKDIIGTYLKNPYSPGLRRKPILNIKPLLKLTGTAAAIVLLLFGIVKVLPVIHTLYSTIHPVLFQTASLPPPEKPQETVPSPEETMVKKEVPVHTTAPVQKKTPVNPLAAGLNKFNAQDYQGVITDFEAIIPAELTAKQKKLRVIRLLQCYIQTGRLNDAQSLCKNEPVSDGLFHLLQSEVALKQNRLEDALEAARSARSATSLYDTSLKKKASFQIASILHSRYLLKPNRKNLENSLKGWQEYISSYCSGSAVSKECSEAAEKAAMLQ